jgi:DNA repair exonuclease SbcCD ATPase subunit
MNENLHTDTEKLQSENATLKGILLEYQQAAIVSNSYQKELDEKATATTELKSYYDLQAVELKYIRSYVNELMQKAEGAAQREADLEKQVSIGVSNSHQLDDIKSKYNLLQAQLTDIEERLQELKTQNIIQQQQVGRIAELESLLENAGQEIEQLRNPSTAKD